MDRFWELMEESVIVQGSITFALVLTTCYLVAVGREIPELFGTALTLVLGYYFGAKSQMAITKTVKRLGNGSSGSDPGTADSNRVV